MVKCFSIETFEYLAQSMVIRAALHVVVVVVEVVENQLQLVMSLEYRSMDCDAPI